MVGCALLIPEPDWTLDLWQHQGALDAVHLASIDPAEWAELAEWVRPRAGELPDLTALLSHLPVRVAAIGVAALAEEFERVDWDSLSGLALGGFASLSAVVSQAIVQAGCGLRFVADPEPH